MYGDQLLVLAKALAYVAHDGVSRRGSGEPYINHVERVVANVEGWRRKTIAYLHDVIEDSHDEVEMEQALRILFPDDIIDDVMLLTRPSNLTYREYIERLIDSDRLDPLMVKHEDLEDNIDDKSDLAERREMNRKRYMPNRALVAAKIAEMTV